MRSPIYQPWNFRSLYSRKTESFLNKFLFLTNTLRNRCEKEEEEEEEEQARDRSSERPVGAARSGSVSLLRLHVCVRV